MRRRAGSGFGRREQSPPGSAGATPLPSLGAAMGTHPQGNQGPREKGCSVGQPGAGLVWHLAQPREQQALLTSRRSHSWMHPACLLHLSSRSIKVSRFRSLNDGPLYGWTAFHPHTVMDWSVVPPPVSHAGLSVDSGASPGNCCSPSLQFCLSKDVVQMES